MRKKAEKKIRQAVAELGSAANHRLDKVRAGAGLHPKVFDKTILDMERVGTITLEAGNINEMTSDEISGFVRRGNTVYVSFNFMDDVEEPKKAEPEIQEPETIVVILYGLYPGEWEQFENACEAREGKHVVQKIEEMIRQYNRDG